MVKPAFHTSDKILEKLSQVVLLTRCGFDWTSHEGINFVPEPEKQRANPGVLGSTWWQSLPPCTPHQAPPSLDLIPLSSIGKISLPDKCFYWPSEKSVKIRQLPSTFVLPITLSLYLCTSVLALALFAVQEKKRVPKGNSCQ